ncbi:hypothetical protein [Microbulbifer rhizosphaerae]|uniref:Uncharacterized protein n=1 Tax=Microbulbifer rhizosphaerae TaxID=1562603 RepID=A0A7W4ZAR8_9GAMM|nr:hypothetical protein [Microbulbifer rhizosphaerae]MBB3063103.1 hypothetical protein [Microbulbifer rhizosphaerae]
MHGLNRKFLRNPQKFLDQYIILMPSIDKGSWRFSSGLQTFDLRRDNRNIFGRQCCLLTTMERRDKDAGMFTNSIYGNWIPINSSGSFTACNIVANRAPYFIFTEQLGGCSIGILNTNSPNTVFAHDPNPNKNKLSDYQLTLSAKQYDPKENDINTSGVCWWDGVQWNIGFCVTYDSTGFYQQIGQDNYTQ